MTETPQEIYENFMQALWRKQFSLPYNAHTQQYYEQISLK